MTEQARILVVEDDTDLLSAVTDILEDANFAVITRDRADGVRELVRSEPIDLIVLDLGLPGIDGFTLLRQFKDQPGIGVIIISGRAEPTEKIVGLELGADDYLTKPFVPRELLARVRSVLRRLPTKRAEAAQETPRILRFDGWSLNEARMEVRDAAGQVVPLTSAEYALLEALVKSPHRVLTRDQLLDLTRGKDVPAFERSIDVLVTRLRKKLGDSPPVLVKTIRNRGYMFTGKVTSQPAAA